jgi:DNA-binding GntR family transcriptional regulator
MKQRTGNTKPSGSPTATPSTSARDETAVGAEVEAPGTPKTSQTDAALDVIRARIIDLSLPPGSRIDEPLLLNEFQLGRTPAREAIHRLMAEGFVRIMPNRGGTFVRKLDFEEIGEIIVAQQIAENVLSQMCNLDDNTLADDLAAIQALYRQEVQRLDYLAITELNERFHMRMNRSLNNGFFYEFAQSTHRHVRRLNVHLYQLESDNPELQKRMFEENLQEHDQIIEAIRNKDREALTHLLPDHAKALQARLAQILQSKTVASFQLKL